MSDEQTSPLPLIDQLRRRQVESWQSGQQTKVEELLHEIAPETLEEDQLLELIYGEICLSDQQGVVVSVAAFADRFPELRDRITRLFEMHEEFERGNPP